MDNLLFRLKALPFALAVLSIIGLVIFAPGAVRGWASQSWPLAEGKVTFINARAVNDSKRGLEYVGEVNFSYAVAGKDYSSNKIDIASYGPTRHSRADALQDVDAYRVGQAVTVSYDPKNPAEGVLQSGVPERIKYGVLIALAIAVVCIPYSAIEGRRNWSAWQVESTAAAAIEPRTPEKAPGEIAFDYDKPESISGVGVVEKVFLPSRANAIAGAIIAIGLFFGGPWAGWKLSTIPPKKPSDRIPGIALCIAIPVLGLVGGVAFDYGSWNILRRRVVIGADGFADVSSGRATTRQWTDVVQFREEFTAESLKVLKVPGGNYHTTDHKLVIRCLDGTEYSFNKMTVPRLDQLKGILQPIAADRSIPWEEIHN